MAHGLPAQQEAADWRVIGGFEQKGNYKLGCRFNKVELIRKVTCIGRDREVVHLGNEDARLCLARWDKALPSRALLNINPPCYAKAASCTSTTSSRATMLHYASRCCA